MVPSVVALILFTGVSLIMLMAVTAWYKQQVVRAVLIMAVAIILQFIFQQSVVISISEQYAQKHLEEYHGN